ncbi:PDR/VanB family oxidoreductase [Glaciihabitans sp. dw_435]|uniref:PDR/VanB family oxidoreductase n=1 Tax=Glaciihabitans sp. dw_435 TaxID=2720081 RepID=UPI001BD2394A|nr:PDR/VanB family oxidoreductase [Glaciihabitans sp. dw_435]
MSHLHDGEFDTVVVGRTRAADGVDFFELGGVDGAALPAWTPGSHIDVVLPSGDERQYSLSGRADAPTWRLGVLRETAGRGGSAWVHDSVAVGDTLRVRGPRNHFAFTPTPGSRYLFLAGGIGITPIAPMVAAAAAAGADFTVAYLGRSRSTMALAAELERDYPGHVSIHAADEGARLDLAALFASLDPGTTIYCCGPTRLIDAVESALESSDHHLHVERFAARALETPLLDEPFEVELAFTGTTLTVPPGRSILDVVEESGVLVLSSCQEGTCGTCETQVISGEVDHRDSILTPEERADNTVMYICVSRAACPRLVLEL